MPTQKHTYIDKYLQIKALHRYAYTEAHIHRHILTYKHLTYIGTDTRMYI